MERIDTVLNGKEFFPKNKEAPKETLRAQIAQYNAQRNIYTSTLKEKENRRGMRISPFEKKGDLR